MNTDERGNAELAGWHRHLSAKHAASSLGSPDKCRWAQPKRPFSKVAPRYFPLFHVENGYLCSFALDFECRRLGGQLRARNGEKNGHKKHEKRVRCRLRQEVWLRRKRVSPPVLRTPTIVREKLTRWQPPFRTTVGVTRVVSSLVSPVVSQNLPRRPGSDTLWTCLPPQA